MSHIRPEVLVSIHLNSDTPTGQVRNGQFNPHHINQFKLASVGTQAQPTVL